MASGCVAQVGRLALLVQVAAVLLVVATLVAVRLTGPFCQAVPFQYLPALGPVVLSRVKVVLLAFWPMPPVLSATLPLKVAGTAEAWKKFPPAGVVTEAMAGAVSSRVKLTALPVKVLPAMSMAVA